MKERSKSPGGSILRLECFTHDKRNAKEAPGYFAKAKKNQNIIFLLIFQSPLTAKML